MKFWYISEGKVMKQLFKHFLNGWIHVREHYATFQHHIASGSANSLVSLSIVALTVFSITTTVSHNNVAVANARLAIAKEEAKHMVETAKIRAEAMRDAAAFQVHAEEIRAAANPYVTAAEHSNTPVNVFIDANDNNYVIETSDGATEIAISTITVKGIKYTPEQRKLMTMAYYIGKEVGFPETIQSFLLQETRAGALGDRIGDVNLPIGKRSYGVMQMKVATARKVLRKYPELVPNYFPNRKNYKRVRDEEIIIKLIQDDEFNMRLAALNFAMHRQLSKSWAQAVVAYNTGQGAANQISEPKKHGYYVNILQKLIKEVRPFNKETKLAI